MTALCPGGGASHPKTGAAAVVDYSAGLLAAIFAAYDLAWLIPILPLVGLAPLTLTTFCTSDPPAVPTFTSAETNAMLQLQFGADFDSGLGKVKDLILNAIWHDACECVSGTATPLAPPTPPAGTPITQFPIGQLGVPCLTKHTLPVGINSTASFARGGLDTYGRNVTYINVTITNAVVIAPGATGRVTITNQNQRVSPTTSDGFSARTVTPGSSVTFQAFPNRDFPTLQINVDGVSGTGTSDIDCFIDVYCDGALPGVPAQACCPPDPATQSYLDNILQLVTLIQRQIVPFAHVLGTVHAGLTGQGTIGVSGLLGVKLNLTTIPAHFGVEVGSPDYHFDLGWLSVLTPDGLIDERRISAQLTSWLPRLMSDATVVGYSLNPGVVGTLTEIAREP